MLLRIILSLLFLKGDTWTTWIWMMRTGIEIYDDGPNYKNVSREDTIEELRDGERLCTRKSHDSSFREQQSVFRTEEVPSGATCTKSQSILWVGSWIYFFNKETWNTLWILRLAWSASWYATGPIRASISKGPQNLGVILAEFPNFNELFWALTFK